MKLFGAYIAPAIYARVWAPFKKSQGSGLNLAVPELVRKFRQSGYERILITADLVECFCKESPLDPGELCVFVTAKQFQKLDLSWVKQERDRGVKWLVASQEIGEALLLCGNEIIDEVLFFVHRKVIVPSDVKKGLLQKLRLVPPYDLKAEIFDQILKTFEIHGIPAQASSYLELGPREDMSLWFDPQFTMQRDRRPEDFDCLNSVVIPFQDNPGELQHTLKNLFLSLEGHHRTEILIVDDSFETQHMAEMLLQLEQSGIPYAYIKMDRLSARQRGDFSFRAGVARNIGAIASRGSELVFMDSDILVGTGFWSKLEGLRRNHSGLCIPRRRFLRAGRGLENKLYPEFKLGQDTQLSWGGHWEDFYRAPEAEKEVWKWTSTYCLALPRQVFMKSGGFRRGFYCYGFEDTELGYRLQKQGCFLQVLDVDVFHLPFSSDRSEYAQDQRQRKGLLKKSFEVFLRSSLAREHRGLFSHILE